MQDAPESVRTGRARRGARELAGELDEAAFERLYLLYFGFTWRVLGHLGVAQHAIDDAVQELWLVVHRRLASFEGRSSVKTWLFGIAINVARNHRRAEGRQRRHVPDPALDGAPLDPQLIHEGREAWRRVERFLVTLDEQRRAIFVCNLLENLSAPETAEATQVDVTTVYQRVRALRQSFKQWLGRELDDGTARA